MKNESVRMECTSYLAVQLDLGHTREFCKEGIRRQSFTDLIVKKRRVWLVLWTIILLRYTVLWTVLIHHFDLGHLSCVHCYGNKFQSGCVVVL